MSVFCPAPTDRQSSADRQSDRPLDAPLHTPCPVALYGHEVVAATDAQQQACVALRRRYQLQQMAANILPHKRALQGCQRWVAYNKDAVQLLSYPALRKGKIEGLQSCASPWDCPVCSSKIATRRVEKQLKPALAEAKRRGYYVVMVTWTIQHNRHDELLALMAALKQARKQLRCSRPWTRIKDRFGIIGSIRALEVTHGQNGWHPHFHELLFLECKADVNLLLAELRAQWSTAIEKAGLREVNDHGVKVSDTYKDVEEYIAKFGKDPKWGVAEEMGRQQTKRARAKKGLSPFQLLGVACDNEGVEGYSPRRAGELFKEYSAAMAGFAQLYGGKLWKLLELPELTDKEIEAMEEERQHREVVAEMTPPEWNCLRADGLHLELYSLLAEGDREGVHKLIEPYLRAAPENAYRGHTLSFKHMMPFDPEDPFSDPRDEENRSLLDITGGRALDPLVYDPRVSECLGHCLTPAEAAAVRAEDDDADLWGAPRPALLVHLAALSRLDAKEAAADASRRVKLPAWLFNAVHDLVVFPGLLDAVLTDKERSLLAAWKQQFKEQPVEALSVDTLPAAIAAAPVTLPVPAPVPAGPVVHQVVSRKGRRLLHRKHVVA